MKINTPYTIVKIKIIYIIADRIAISTKRFSKKLILHFYSIYRKCSTYTTKAAPRQRLPTIRVKWILNNIATFTTSTRLPNT